MATRDELSRELRRLNTTGFAAKLQQQAAANGFSTAFFYAIASRETNCINEMGDRQNGEFHGVGIIQIDIQHPIARQARDDESWRTNPDPLIAFGAQMLAQNIHAARATFPDFSDNEQLKVAASGYNCGISRAISGARNGDSDQHTTGRDYGRDVMGRMAIFEELLTEAAGD
jgi:hypothetical protein